MKAVLLCLLSVVSVVVVALPVQLSLSLPLPHNSLLAHGSFVNVNRTDSKLKYVDVLHTAQAPLQWIDRYSDALFAVGLLLLVPITLAIVQIAECLARAVSVEEFPDRGREKERWLTLEERQEWILQRKHRERKVNRCWWKSTARR